jgi:hypothetical protein
MILNLTLLIFGVLWGIFLIAAGYYFYVEDKDR